MDVYWGKEQNRRLKKRLTWDSDSEKHSKSLLSQPGGTPQTAEEDDEYTGGHIDRIQEQALSVGRRIVLTGPHYRGKWHRRS